MIKDSINGAGYFFKGLSLINQAGIRRYVVIPLAFNILIFSLLIAYGYQQFGDLLNWLLPDPDSWFNWLRWIFIPVFVSVAAVAVFFLFTILANFIGAPFNALLADAVERHLTGTVKESSSDLQDVLKAIGPAMISELKKILYYLIISSPFLILFFVTLIFPPLNLIVSVSWLLVTAWILTVQYCDYPFDNHDIDFAQLRQQLGKKRFMTFGFGGATMLMMAVPIINFLVMPTAVAGATAMSLKEFKLDSNVEHGE